MFNLVDIILASEGIIRLTLISILTLIFGGSNILTKEDKSFWNSMKRVGGDKSADIYGNTVNTSASVCATTNEPKESQVVFDDFNNIKFANIFNSTESQIILQTIFENSQAGIAIVNKKDRKLCYINKSGLLGRDKYKKEVADEIYKEGYLEELNIFHLDGMPYEEDEIPLIRAMVFGETCSEEVIIRRSDFEDRIIWANVSPIKDNKGKIIAAVIVFHDITERKKEEEEIFHLSYHDQLTGMYNRRFFEEEVSRLDTERNLPISIIMGDVNGLKLVNDSFGHAVGDELLLKVSEVIKKACRADDIIARYGGDEFVILLPKTDVAKAKQIIVRIKDLASKEKVGSLDVSISFGSETKVTVEDSIHDVFKKSEDEMYKNKLYESAGMRTKAIDIIMNALYLKSNREMMHSKRVSEICVAIATNMNFNNDDVKQIRLAGLMHDIGNIGIDEKILNKPKELSRDEWAEMERHCEIGYRILSSANEFSEIAEHVLEHHEKWGGKGYPRGLKGEEISVQARIIEVADTYDALTNERTFRDALTEDEAIEEIRRCAGTQFDPNVARIFVQKVLGKEWEVDSSKVN